MNMNSSDQITTQTTQKEELIDFENPSSYIPLSQTIELENHGPLLADATQLLPSIGSEGFNQICNNEQLRQLTNFPVVNQPTRSEDILQNVQNVNSTSLNLPVVVPPMIKALKNGNLIFPGGHHMSWLKQLELFSKCRCF